MNKTYYVCKYTPVELLEALGGECEILNDMPEGFDLAEQVAHPKPQIQGIGAGIRGMGINTRFPHTLSFPPFRKKCS